MIKQVLSQLLDLTKENDIIAIKAILEGFDIRYKGTIFEQYLVELFKGNGWLAVNNGGKNDAGADILLYHPKLPEKIFLIVQAKNYNRPLTFDDTKVELIKFEKKSKYLYKCNNYLLISINGFVKASKELEEFNMKLENWSYVRELINNYGKIPLEEPNIELYAHNKIAYKNSQKLLKYKRKIAFIQATGTGKSYIIIKYLADFINKGCIVLAPSIYILEQIKKKCFWITENTDFMTYAKLKNFTEGDIKLLKYDLIILDEFHRCGAEFWGKGVKRLLDNNKKSIILGTSATPIRYSDNERDMAIELFENNIAVNLSLVESIVKKILPMPTYISALYTLDEEVSHLSNKIANSNLGENYKVIYSNKLTSIKKDWDNANGIPYILKKYIKNNENKFIVFCENKEHLYEMEWLVEKWFKQSNLSNNIKKYRLISNDIEADDELKKFIQGKEKSKTYLLFAIDMLNEGVHIDDVSGVILLRNTKSPRVFYQQIGRAIQSGNIENPLIFDFVNNFNNICSGDFIEDLEEAKMKELKKRAHLGLEDNCPSFTIIDEAMETKELFDELEDKLSNLWQYWYNKLVEYKNIHGTTIIPIEEHELNKWCSRQRSLFRQSKLLKERLDMLNSLNFVWDLNEYRWWQTYEKLKEFKKKNGHCRVPRNYYDDQHLGFWVITQRKKEHMTEERLNALNEINFDWGHDSRWMDAYEELKKFKEKYGHCNVPKSYSEYKFSLHSWVTNQKLKLHGKDKRKPLSDEQMQLLNAIGFEFNKDEKWDGMFQEYIKFTNEVGRSFVRREENSKLANWVSRQRKYYKQGNLSEEKINKLRDVKFDFKG